MKVCTPYLGANFKSKFIKVNDTLTNYDTKKYNCAKILTLNKHTKSWCPSDKLTQKLEEE